MDDTDSIPESKDEQTEAGIELQKDKNCVGAPAGNDFSPAGVIVVGEHRVKDRPHFIA